jgi:hypothetical protein
MKTRDLLNLAKSGLAINTIALSVLITGCAAPKSITDSGKVTPKSQIKFGANYQANVPTQTIKNAVELVSSGVGAVKFVKKNIEEQNPEAVFNAIGNSDRFKSHAGAISKYMIGYAVDPMNYGLNYYVRYGIARRFDIGYQYSGGTNAFDIKYQFLGTTGTIGSESSHKLYGSIGLQYSARQYELPARFRMVEEVIDFNFKRKDFFIPVIFSKSFGNEEKKGHFSWGVAYNGTFLSYALKETISDKYHIDLPIPSIDEKKYFSSYGTFINLKVGHKCVYFLASFAAYYTNYGTYKLIDGTSARLKGFTYVPTLGMQFVIPPLHKKKVRS